MSGAVWIKLEIDGDLDAAADVLGRMLDRGVPQDEFNEACAGDCDARVTSATVEVEGPAAPTSAVKFTDRQLAAAGAAISAMLAGEGPGVGDWPEEVTHGDMVGAGRKVGVR